MVRQRIARMLVIVSAIVLIGTALLHALAGYPALSRALAGTSLKPSVIMVLEIFWISLSVHWVIAAMLALWAVFHGTERGGALILLLAALLPGFDGVAGLVRVGLFAGNGLLIIGSILLVAAAIGLAWPARYDEPSQGQPTDG